MVAKIMIKTVCNCDKCEKDLSSTSNIINYRIFLKSERIPCHDGAVTAMMIHPQIKDELHFCDIKCFKSYVNEKL